MKVLQIDLNRDYSDAIREAVNVLKYGGTVVYPTDTLYGLGANALNEIAVRKIFRIKQRSASKPLPIVVRNMLWAEELAHITARNKSALEKMWPGRVTAVLPKREIVPSDLTAGHPSIAIRIPDHALVSELLGRFGYPLTATSANISGDEPTVRIDDIVAVFSGMADKPDLILDAGTLPIAEPSTIIDLTDREPKILRIGASKPEQLLKLLNDL